VEIRILGPIEVRENGQPVPLGGPKQRAVLALLVLNANRVLSRDALIDQLWDGDPPPTAATALHGHVSALRKALGADVIVTRSPGYVLLAGPEQIDLSRFESLRGRGDLHGALGLWRGEALEDVRLEPALSADAARLDDLRLSALEDRIDADLEDGVGADLVGELEGLVASHPLRERLWGQLMLALYRAGRQADALDAYRRARHRLIAELGIEPSQSVRELHQRILEQDPALDAPRPAAPAGRRPRRLSLAALAAAVAVAIAAVVLVAGDSDDSIDVPPDSVAILDIERGAVSGAIPLAGPPGPVAAGAGAVWVLNVKNATLSRIDPRARELTGTDGVNGSPGTMTTAATEVWISEGCSDGTDPGLTHIATTRDGDLVDLTFDKVPLDASVLADEPEALQPLATLQCGLAAAGDSAWVSVNDPAGVARVDYDHARAASHLARVVRLPRAPAALAIGAGALWAADSDRGVVRRLDPDSGRVVGAVRVGREPVALTVGAGAVWVVNRQDESLSRIDPRTGSVTKTLSVGGLPLAVAVGAGSVWVANGGDGTVSRVDPRTNEVSETISVGHPPRGIAVAAGAVWVTVSR
jgi:YVTN family beta-propeller protein